MALDIYPTTQNGYADQILRCTPNDYTTFKTEIVRNEVQICPTIKQQELAEATGKSIATIKRIMKSLQDKNYIRRESGKRYGKWEVMV